jgi:hypothetical protein
VLVIIVAGISERQHFGGKRASSLMAVLELSASRIATECSKEFVYTLLACGGMARSICVGMGVL